MSEMAKQVESLATVTFRSQQISWVISTHGVAKGLANLGFCVGKQGLKWVGAPVRVEPLNRTFGRNLSRTLMKLGPTFIKLGQILATRPDLVGEPVAEELKVLFDRVTPVDFRSIRKILKQELGRRKLRKHFKFIDPNPMASASISQTHRAVLGSGAPVILKVQKPGVARTVRADLKILAGLLKPMNALYPKYQIWKMYEDFREATLSEIDYRREAENIDRFLKNYRKLFSASDVSFPKYYPEVSTERVLAMEPMRGQKISELRKGSTVARKAAAKGLEAVLEQIFEHGFFHADPHSGNLFFIEEEGRMGFIDLGLVGQLQPEDKKKFLHVVMAVLKRDRLRLAKALYRLGDSAPNTDYLKFEGEVQALIDDAKKQGVDNLKLEEMMNRLLGIARNNSIHVPNRYVMMLRSCLIIEGVAKSLDPNISMFSVATPVVARSLMNSYNPIQMIRRFI